MIPWKLWTSLPSLELWQAVALLVDIDPDSLTHHPDAWMAGPGRGPVLESRSFPSAAKREAFDKALSFAKRAATYGGPIALPRGYPPSAAGTADVALREVAAFFLGCDWPDIPAPMLALLTVEDSPQAALPTETEPAPAAGAGGAAVDGPPPLTSPQIADAFNGIDDLSALQWRARLGEPPKWLEVERTRASIGTAPKPSTWWPLELARILAKRGVAYESLNRKFVNERALKPWLPRWQAERRERNGLEQ